MTILARSAGWVRPLAWHAATAVGTVIGAAGLALLLIALAPGDPIDLIPDGEALRSELEAEWGLDRPLPVRWLTSLMQLAVGDFGTSISYRPGASVWSVIGPAALRSTGWLLCALALSMGWATAIAWWTVERRSVTRHVVRWISVAPVFLLAHIAVHALNEVTFAGIQAGWFDRPGWFALPDQPSTFRTALAITLLAVGSGALTELHLEVESVIRRVRSRTFIDAIRARGLPTWPHVAFHLLPELASLAATRAAFFVGGLVILERVLLLNGAGAVLWRAALLRDHPVAVGVAVLAAAFVASTRFAADGLRLAIDPRLRALETT